MAALEIVSLDTTTPQLRAPSAADTYTAPRAMDITPVALTGSAATSSLSIAQTWNTTGAPIALDVVVTDTASSSASALARFRVGSSNRLLINKTGANSFQGSLLAGDSSKNVEISESASRGVTVKVGVGYNFSNGNADGAIDLSLYRDAANTLAQRNGVNAQAFNIYNTYTDASNYERGFVRWSSNAFEIGSERAGTGSNRNVVVNAAGLVEIKAGGSTRVAFFGATTQFQSDVAPWTSGSQNLGTSSIKWNNIFSLGYSEMTEMTAPAAPATNGVRIYAEDNGAGKTRLMALFATGVAQQLAVEP